jgi:hypothetical protein
MPPDRSGEMMIQMVVAGKGFACSRRLRLGSATVDAIDEARVRASFVNCSKGEIGRMNVPPLADLAWDRLEFLGWRDPKAPDRGYLVTPWDGDFVGIALRAAPERVPASPAAASARSA